MSLRIATIIACIRRAGPYLAIELILPGGSLIALCIWLVKNRAQLRASLWGFGNTCEHEDLVVNQ
ncbi:MAG TPA: hypothetical protein VMA54_13640 [Steroidobacteraceae bacterium]|nr:hypothetical protein [Steroidobacteraceae bacterium]